jgi:dihydrofolate reductase
LRAGRVDTLELGVVPVVIGDGIPLFGKDVPVTRLGLSATKACPNGLVCLD